MQCEVVADGVRFGEGPVWCGNNSLVVTSVADGALYRIDVATGAMALFADTGGGANGAALAADGSMLVTQNGGIDFAALGLFPEPTPFRRATPGLQLARSRRLRLLPRRSGLPRAERPRDRRRRSRVLHRSGAAPAAGDPDRPGDDPRARRNDQRSSPTASPTATASRSHPVASSSWSKARGLQAVGADGEREWVIEHLGAGGGDGFCLDVDGRYYVASTSDHGVRVVDPDGTVVDFLPIPGDGLTTNCCFGGDDLRTLYATDALPGRVVAWEGLPTPGLQLPPWPGLID